jgi:hypothetical protein
MNAYAVQFLVLFEDILWTEFYAELAAFTSVFDDEYVGVSQLQSLGR